MTCLSCGTCRGGDISLVGPRPLVPDEDELVQDGWSRRRLELTPSMTGPWQIPGGGPRAAPADGEARLPVRHRLVALERREDAASHGELRSRARQRLSAVTYFFLVFALGFCAAWQ
jgi:hypothetical protein